VEQFGLAGLWLGKFFYGGLARLARQALAIGRVELRATSDADILREHLKK
jgi:hypothetical protein